MYPPIPTHTPSCAVVLLGVLEWVPLFPYTHTRMAWVLLPVSLCIVLKLLGRCNTMRAPQALMALRSEVVKQGGTRQRAVHRQVGGA
jgi:hypothetical protein